MPMQILQELHRRCILNRNNVSLKKKNKLLIQYLSKFYKNRYMNGVKRLNIML